MAGVAAGQPLDLIRIRQQQPNYRGQGLVPMIHAVLRTEGALALYRGVAYPFLTSAFQNALIFQAYGRTCRLLLGDEEKERQRALPLHHVALGGAVAGVVQTAVCTPVELLKVRLQLQTTLPGQPGYVGSFGMLHKILSIHGLRGLYRGMGATAARDLPSFAAYFSTFEVVRDALDPGSRAERRPTAPLAALAAGGAAGMACWLVSYPADVVKSRMQARSSAIGAWETLRSILHTEGSIALFKGLPATLIRALLVNGTIFAVYEICHARLAAAKEAVTE